MRNLRTLPFVGVLLSFFSRFFNKNIDAAPKVKTLMPFTPKYAAGKIKVRSTKKHHKLRKFHFGTFSPVNSLARGKR